MCNSPSVLVVELQHTNGSLFIINIYNPSDNSALIPLLDLQVLSTHPCIISGDFNLHHPLWSLDSADLKSTPTADILVDSLTNLGFTILNHKGVTTFFRKEYQLVLDLTWTSPDVHIQDWKVAYHRHTGSDHYPITWTLNVSPIAEGTPNVSYAFCETNKDQWFERFLSIIDDHWDFDAEINTVEDLELAITTYISILTRASNLACSRKHKNPRSARWWNEDTQAALKAMRKDRNRARWTPTPHNLLRSKTSHTQFKYQVKRAKCSHTLKIAAETPTEKIWTLNNWYRGVRKTRTPALINPDSTIATTTQDKATLLMQNWFLPVTPIPGSFVTNMLEPLPNISRPFSKVTKEEINKALKTTSNTSAPGLSSLNYQVLKWARLMYLEVFDRLIAKSVSLRFQHPSWKRSMIITFTKPNKPAYNVPKSY